MGLFHVNEHVTRSVPRIVQMKNILKAKTKPINDLNLDMESTLETTRALQKLDTFSSIANLIKKAQKTVQDIQAGRPAPPLEKSGEVSAPSIQEPSIPAPTTISDDKVDVPSVVVEATPPESQDAENAAATAPSEPEEF